MYIIYTAKEGENILSITNRLGITPDEIRKINGFPPNYEVAPGEQIIVPSVSADPFDNYMVKKGDSLYQIAQDYNIDVNDLAKLNGIDPDDFIYPNQELLVPKENVFFYITQQGDTVDKIRQQFPSDFEQIFRNNKYIYLVPDQVLVYKKTEISWNKFISFFYNSFKCLFFLSFIVYNYNRKRHRMKKIIVIILTCIFIVGCVNKKPYIEIKYKEFANKIENKESFILYIGSTDCSFCERYEKTLKRVVNKYNVDVYYINVAKEKISSEDKTSLNNVVDFSGTPTTVFIKAGEVESRYNRIDGAVTSDKIIEAFVRNGYIEKK